MTNYHRKIDSSLLHPKFQEFLILVGEERLVQLLEILASYAKKETLAKQKSLISFVTTIAKETTNLGWAFTIVAHSLSIIMLRRYGQSPNTDNYLKELAGLRSLGAICNAEFGCGTDILKIRSYVQRLDDHKFRLNIKKDIATNLPDADIAIASFWLGDGPERKIAVGCFETSLPGIQKSSLQLDTLKSGINGSLFAENTEVRSDSFSLLDVSGKRFFKDCFCTERILVAAAVNGVSKGVLSRALKLLRTETGRKNKFVQNQYLQEKFATIYNEGAIIEATLNYCLGDLDSSTKEMDIAEEKLAALKLNTTNSALNISSAFIDLFGAAGLSAEHEANKIFKDMQALRSLGGTRELQKICIFQALLRQANATDIEVPEIGKAQDKFDGVA